MHSQNNKKQSFLSFAHCIRKMATKLIQQRRGKGSPTYKSPGHRFPGAIAFPSASDKRLSGEVIDIINSRAHSAPLACLEFEDGQKCMVPAVQGLRVGQDIETGKGAEPAIGSIAEIQDIPAGIPISAIEKTPGNDAALVRSAGGSARVIGEEGGKIMVQLPSRKKIMLNKKCRAVVGRIAGAGRKEKPFVKAGKKAKAMRAKNKLYPRVSGVAMNVVDHPFGGTHRRTKSKSKSVGRDAPPGRKVGHIASKRSGRKKK